MKRKIIVLLSALAVLVVLCAAYFYVEIYPYTLMGEVVDVYNDLSEVVVTLKMNPDSKFRSQDEVVDVYVGEAPTYEIGDKLFVYCDKVSLDFSPPIVYAKWIYRYDSVR